jgi:Na+/melibiose symporter-like transporter
VPNAAQSPRVLLALRVLYVVVPCACNALAFLVLLAYPLDRAAHQAITEALAQRRSRAEAA